MKIQWSPKIYDKRKFICFIISKNMMIVESGVKFIQENYPTF